MKPVEARILALAGLGLHGAPPPPRDGWADHFDEVVRHGLAGFLGRAADTGAVDLDAETAERLRDRLEAEALRAVLLEGELVRLSGALQSLPHVIIKGPVLAHGTFDDPAVRPFTDLDLLVPGRNIAEAIDALRPFGYERVRPEPAPGFDEHVGKALVLRGPGNVFIDLHRALAPGRAGRGVDVDEIVANRIHVPVGMIDVAAPTWEAHLVAASLHAVVGDGLQRALSLRDVAQLTLHPGLDADAVTTSARRGGVDDVVGHALAAASRSFGLSLTPTLAELAMQATGPPPPADREARSTSTRLEDLRSGGLTNRVRASRALFLPTVEFLRWNYGDEPTPRLYARRWIDLAQRSRSSRRDAREPREEASDGAADAGPDDAPALGRRSRQRVPRHLSTSTAAVTAAHSRASEQTVAHRRSDPPPTERFHAWERRHEPPRDAPPAATYDRPPVRPDPDSSSGDPAHRPRRSTPSGVPWFFAGAALLVVTIGGVQLGIDGMSIVSVPLAAVSLAIAASRRITRTRPDEAWVGRWLVAGIVVKLVASYLRYYTLVFGYEGVGDATGYDGFGQQFARAWLEGGAAPELEDLRRTNFIRWFTGVVYYLFGSDMLTGFFVFGLLAVVGSYLWYRATADALPTILDKRLYLGLVLFTPSIAFWPSSIGKESLMQLGVGTMALATSLLLRQRLTVAIPLGAAGGWLLWVVRPHLLALVVVAAAGAYVVGRVGAHGRARGSMMTRPVGLAVILVAVAFAVSQGAEFLGIEEFSVSAIEDELDEQTERSAQGGSEFEGPDNSLNPINLPGKAVTVLLRPFPWETDTNFQLLASLESVLIALLIVSRLSSVGRSLSLARTRPFILYCLLLTIMYSATFASFANFGLLVRQRSLVLPALFVLISLHSATSSSRRSQQADLTRDPHVDAT